MVGDALRPPPWRSTVAVVLAFGVWTAAAVIGTAVYMSWPAPPPPPPPSPFDVLEVRTSEPRPGVWRVELDVASVATCEAVVVDRTFVPSIGPVFRQRPLDAFMDGLGTAPYSRPIRPGALSVWHEYEMTRASSGHHHVTVAAYGCDSGFQGSVGTWRVPYDWPGTGR